MSEPIYIGIDSGATTSKIAAVRSDGSIFPSELLQRPTCSEGGTAAVIGAWIGAINEFLAKHSLAWSQVEGVGLAVPGPRRSYGVLDTSPNLPAEFDGWNVESDLRVALERESGRILPLALGNDGNLGGVAEAYRARAAWSCWHPAPVLAARMSMPRACRSTAIRLPAWRPVTWPRRYTFWGRMS
jgi:predicted NBD/HSP70 family sugar kinase